MIADHILAEVDRLWKGLGEKSAGGVVRASAMTLIVLADGADAPAELAEQAAKVMRSHPNRTVVLRLLQSGSPVDYRVIAQCWRPFGHEEQICSERIEIDTGNPSELGPILLAVAAADLPVVIWARGSRNLDAALAIERLFHASKIIVDSEDLGRPSAALRRIADGVAQSHHIADLAWARVTPLREMIAQACQEGEAAGALRAVTSVRIAHGGSPPVPRACYLAAWLGNALGRLPEVRFEVAERAAGEIAAIELVAGERVVAAARVTGAGAEIAACATRARAMHSIREDADLLNEELAIEGRDRTYEAIVPIAAQIAEREAGS